MGFMLVILFEVVEEKCFFHRAQQNSTALKEAGWHEVHTQWRVLKGVGGS